MSALWKNSSRKQWRLVLSALRANRSLSLSASPPYLELTHQDIFKLPLTKFTGECIVISTLEDEQKYASAIDTLFKKSVLGFDSEWHCRRPRRSPSLVQLASEDVCIMWRLCYQDQESLFVGEKFPPRLLYLLTSRKITKVGHASNQDAYLLLKHYYVNTCSVFNTYPFSRSLSLPMEGLRGLAGMLLGIQITKSQAKTNWESRQLSEQQLRYASTDAWVSLEVYKALMKYAVLQGVSAPQPVRSAFDLVPDPKEKMYLGRKVKRAMMLRAELQKRAEHRDPPDKIDLKTKRHQGILERIKDVINQFLMKIEASEQSAGAPSPVISDASTNNRGGQEESLSPDHWTSPYLEREEVNCATTNFDKCTLSEDSISYKRQPMASVVDGNHNGRDWRASSSNSRAATEVYKPCTTDLSVNETAPSLCLPLNNVSPSLREDKNWVDLAPTEALNKEPLVDTRRNMFNYQSVCEENVVHAIRTQHGVADDIPPSNKCTSPERDSYYVCGPVENEDEVLDRDSEVDSPEELARNLHVVPS